MNKKEAGSKFKKTVPLWVWLAGIIVITIITYFSAFTNGFTNWDDEAYVTGSTIIQSLYFSNIFNFFSILQAQGNYHPLTLLSLAIDYKLFGMNPMGYHTINILLHLFNVCLVFLLTQKLFKSQFITTITTLLFAIHPMHVESVAWISERKDVLYTFFYLAGLLFYVNYLEKKKRAPIIYMVACFILSLLSKAQAVTFPIALMLVDYIINGKLSIRSIFFKTPLLIVSITAGIVAVIAQRNYDAITTAKHFSLPDRILMPAYAFAVYIIKFFAPVNLAADYPYPSYNNSSYDIVVYLSWLIPIAYITLLIIFRKNKIVAGSLIFFLLNIVLLLQFLPVGNAIVAERYTYLSYLGLFWVLAYTLAFLIQKLPTWRAGIIAGISMYIIFLCYISFQRIPIWHDSMVLWQNEVAQFPADPIGWDGLGLAYNDVSDLTNAKACFNHAISEDPDYVVALVNRSNTYIHLAQYDSAIHDAKRALMLAPNSKTAHQNRGIAYAYINKADSGLIDGRWMVLHYPNDTTSYFNEGFAFIGANKPDSAILDYNVVLTIYPNEENAYAMRGIAYSMLNRMNNAFESFNKAIELKPNDWQAYGNRARAYLIIGSNEKAIDDATVAINNYHGNVASFIVTRAQAFYNLGKYRDALQDYLSLQKLGVQLTPSTVVALEKKAGEN